MADPSSPIWMGAYPSFLTFTESRVHMGERYDLIVIGLGPAGMAAGIYAARRRMKTLVIGRAPGGTAATAHLIENYPGVLATTGLELMETMEKQLRGFEVGVEVDEVLKATRSDDGFTVRCASGVEHSSTSLVLATGTEVQRLGVPGEKEMSGRGVSYCATCDGPLFRDRTVAVAGDGNRAVDAALLLSEVASHVILISSGAISADESLVARLDKEKVEVLEGSRITSIKGDPLVEAVSIEDADGTRELAVEGVFVEVGSMPATEIASSLGADTDRSFVVVDDNQSTNVQGLYAAGDVTGRWAQVVMACAQGAVAATKACGYIRKCSREGR